MNMRDFASREELYESILRSIWRGRKYKGTCSVPLISVGYNSGDKYRYATTVAALWALAGVKKVTIPERFEHYSISQMLFSTTSLITTPYVEVKTTNLIKSNAAVWWICELLGLRGGGGASRDSNFVQVGWLPRTSENPVSAVDVHTVFDSVRKKILRDYPGSSSAQAMYDYYKKLEEGE